MTKSNHDIALSLAMGADWTLLSHTGFPSAWTSLADGIEKVLDEKDAKLKYLHDFIENVLNENDERDERDKQEKARIELTKIGASWGGYDDKPRAR